MDLASRSESELSINVMVLRTVQSPLFFRKIVENERYAILTRSSLNYLKGGGRFGNPELRSLGGTVESNYKMAASEGERSISTILRKIRGL